jgi:hypothetical protein
MASGSRKAQQRGPTTGRPYAKFTDVSAQAGLDAVMVYGGVERIQFIIESMGGG